ncbi:hypothetical protein BD309DRAFT_445634 [Dichomitus squalens]|uniref:Uncharacterized protein n=1 Tax=Dichomitus squalens TaxID=114155 RepID=A0A4Q9N4C6_9APHY|nr:hypothetical protein BD311DRAFT_748164 [Dichomitus squalens]TBU47627.1 hypothetical protein BD309DRAFT_445634 [Dichomitus squalens]TBU56860.1 hypothetical protein BD310DRAFT_595868 [Dichomitus squalens]
MHGSRRLHRPHVFFFPYWFISRMRQHGLQLTRPDHELEDGLAVELADSTPSICVTFIKPSANPLRSNRHPFISSLDRDAAVPAINGRLTSTDYGWT